MIYLQISTAQGPAECRIFARFVEKTAGRSRSAECEGSDCRRNGRQTRHPVGRPDAGGSGCRHVEGTLQWVCASPVCPKHPRKNWYIGIFRLPEKPEMPSESEIEFQTCRSGGKGGQHVNKTESAVRATHKASGISVRVESERSQHANKKRALELLTHKLAEHQTAQNADYAKQQHSGLYQVERGNPKRVFEGLGFRERYA